MNKKYLSRGHELIMLGPQDTRLGPWLIMSGRRLLMSGPKLLHWEYGRGPEINMSGPRLIMSEPLFMSGPRDNYVRAPFLLFWGSEIIMLGPDLSCEDPRFTMSWPQDYYVGAPTMLGPPLVMSGPRDMGTLTHYVGGEIIMFGPRFMMLGPLLSCRGPRYYVT